MSDQLVVTEEAAPKAVQTPDDAAPTEIEDVGSEEQTPLSPEEQSRLQDSERVIEAGLGQFLAVGTALSRIKRDRLYRDNFKTFKEYCEERWQFGASYAYRLIESAECVAQLEEKADASGCSVFPSNEYQVRQLLKLKKPKSRVTAWKTAVKEAHGASVTAEIVKKVVSAKLPKSSKKPPTKATKKGAKHPLDTIAALVSKELEKSKDLKPNLKKLLEKILELTGANEKSST